MVAMSMGWGREALQALPCVSGGIERSKGSLELVHPRKNSVSGSRVVESVEATLCGGVCVEAGCGRGGRAIKRLQRSKNSANESCVAVSASVAGITLPATFRVGPAGTCELVALCGNCGLDTEPEGAVPLVSCVEASGCAVDEELVPSCNCWRECSGESQGTPV